MGLSREQLLKPAAVPVEVVTVPEFDGTVSIKGMTARQRSKFEEQFTTAAGNPNRKRRAQMRERLIVACCVDDDGQPLFTEEDVPAIGDMPAVVIEPLVDACQRVVGFTSADVESLTGKSDDTEADS